MIAYKIFNPNGEWIASSNSRANVKHTLKALNQDVPSWHYDELYKQSAYIVDREDMPNGSNQD